MGDARADDKELRRILSAGILIFSLLKFSFCTTMFVLVAMCRLHACQNTKLTINTFKYLVVKFMKFISCQFPPFRKYIPSFTNTFLYGKIFSSTFSNAYCSWVFPTRSCPLFLVPWTMQLQRSMIWKLGFLHLVHIENWCHVRIVQITSQEN